MQSSAANLCASLAAVLAGLILQKLAQPLDFALCFLLASAAMLISLFWLRLTREQESPPSEGASQQEFWRSAAGILRGDSNFRWFLAARMLSQVAVMAYAFYTVYAVRRLGMSEMTVGVMTSLLMGVQIVASPLMGWIGDRWSHRYLFEIGVAAATASALLAWFAPGPDWFYLVFALAGIGNVAVWTISLAMILDFGSEAQRPAYIGLANTLVAPTTILAPLIGGWLAELAGFPAAFVAAAAGGIVTMLVLHFLVRDPRGPAPVSVRPL
jgi:predicted MFS family arabinose efflux permease